MIKSIYYYLVLFTTLVMTIGGTVAAFMAIADIIMPDTYYQSYTEFKEMKRINETKYNDKGQVIQQPTLNDEELRKEYERIIQEQADRTKSRAINSLIKSLGWIVIPLPIFIYYQRRVKEKAV